MINKWMIKIDWKAEWEYTPLDDRRTKRDAGIKWGLHKGGIEKIQAEEYWKRITVAQ